MEPVPQLADVLLGVVTSILGDSRAIYCSAPLTSGKRYFKWLTTRGHCLEVDHLSEADRTSHITDVVTPNRAHAGLVAARLRTDTGRPVIDPTTVPAVATWTQRDWLDFWERVLRRHAS